MNDRDYIYLILEGWRDHSDNLNDFFEREAARAEQRLIKNNEFFSRLRYAYKCLLCQRYERAQKYLRDFENDIKESAPDNITFKWEKALWRPKVHRKKKP